MLVKNSLLSLTVIFVSWNALALAQPGPQPAGPGADEPAPAAVASSAAAGNSVTPETGPVAATVNGEPIYAAEVEKPFEAMQKAGRLGKEDPRWVKARMLSQLVDRRIAKQSLLSDKSLYTDEEVDAQLKQLGESAEKQGATLEKLAAAQGVSLDSVRQDVAMRVALQRYVQKQLRTVLPQFAREHQREFDGTEIRASHIMLRPGGYTESLESLVSRASTIREEITSGKIDFEAAAKKYSNAPSRERGGDIGFVTRRGEMAEPFAAALFQLKTGEVSPPVATPLGVHLIKAGEIKPGTKDIKDSMQQIQQMAAEDIFKRLIRDQRALAKIEYSGAVPYFKPGTEELAMP
jgi:parvulin-like peptidyl-prolyl isomerase